MKSVGHRELFINVATKTFTENNDREFFKFLRCLSRCARWRKRDDSASILCFVFVSRASNSPRRSKHNPKDPNDDI